MSRGMCTTLVTAQSIIAAAKLREVECMEYRPARAETISDSYIITLVLLFKLDIMSAGLQRDNMEYSLARVVTGCGSKLAVLALSAQLSTAAAGLRDLRIVNYGHARAGVGSNSKHITLVLTVKLYIPAAELQKNYEIQPGLGEDGLQQRVCVGAVNPARHRGGQAGGARGPELQPCAGSDVEQLQDQ